METTLTKVGSSVTFRNSKGAEVRGDLVHLSRDSVVFEVYSPYAVVQSGEPLDGLVVSRRGRPVYTGGAIASSVLSTGLHLIITATPLGTWTRVDDMGPNGRLHSEAHALMHDWETRRELLPGYQIAVTNVRGFLDQLSRWVRPIDLAMAASDSPYPSELPRRIAEELDALVYPQMKQLFGKFERAAGQVPPDEAEQHKFFVRQELHPLTLCAPFVHRTFTKPLGYPGDYEMVNMILRDRFEGPSTHARLVNSFILSSDTAEAHRNRINKLVEYLRAETRRVTSEGRRPRVLNVGCGPSAEICRFIQADPLSERCDLVLLDFNEETIGYAKAQVRHAQEQSGRTVNVQFVQRSVAELLREGSRRTAESKPEYDLIYCAGLFDYLSDKTCARLLQLFCGWMRQRGLVVASNVHPRHSVRYFLEHLLDWNLNLRNEQDMQSLARESAGVVSVCTEATGVNVFLEIRSTET